MSRARFIVGDVRDVLATIPDGSVDSVVTSPPFLALRSYLPADHPDKHREIGSEPTPAEFLRTLLELTGELRRVLAPHGSICVELGDTYSGGWVGESTPQDERANAEGGTRLQDRRRNSHAKRNKLRESNLRGWPLPKSMCGIPTLYAWSLAYGRNLLDPTQTVEPWRIRNVLVWARPNPPVGALGDKFRPAVSYITVACVSDRRWFDLDAVRHEGVEPGAVKRKTKNHSGANPRSGWTSDNATIVQNPNGAPPLDWHSDCEPGTHDGDRLWVMPTQPYAGAHYATFPSELPARLVKAMCPMQVCVVCGEPRRRMTSAEYEPLQATNNPTARGAVGGVNGAGSDPTFVHGRAAKRVETLGWSDCGHDDWRNGLVLDPFAGSGSTLAAATGAGRDALGIDIDRRNLDLARERVGMFLEAEVVL